MSGQSAVVSECGTYRYLLKRPPSWLGADKTTAAFLMLNPSTADAVQDDPTIRRCLGFAKAWGCAGVVVVNLYGLRSTDPSALWKHPDPVGPENDAYLAKVAREIGDVVCAWGAHARPDRVARVAAILANNGARLWCLKTTKSGAPGHPLYVAADTRLRPWVAA